MIYEVQSNGKAPSGLKKGDTVVTGGGTYKITGINSDGSYKSTKVNDTTTSSYTGSYATPPSLGGDSSAGLKGGGSSSGTNKNSQYTATNLGDTWDANTDYQSIIDKAVDNGDYVTAAKAEQLRNQKIIATGSNHVTTNNYKGWLDTTDYSTQMWEGMENGISAQEMQELWDRRYEKANGTIGLNQYKDDKLMQIAQNYIDQQLALERSQAMLDKREEDNSKEGYQRPYDPQIDALLNEILNRGDFSYDVMNDPLYQQYAKMYQREGDRAMKETMAEAAAGAGGMNTYAITAAQQANNYYNSQLNDKIPQLYQLAYDMYINDKESKVQDLGILQNMDATQYNRYRDTINDWYNDKNFAYGVYQDAVQQGNWQTTFNNNNYWANKEFDNTNYWKDKEFNANQGQIDIENSRIDQETAKAEIEWYIENGVTTINPDLVERAGLDEIAVNQMIAQKQAEKANQGRSSGGGISKSGSGGDGEYTGITGDNGKNKNNSPIIEDEPISVNFNPFEKLTNYPAVDGACQELLATEGKSAVNDYLNELIKAGVIDQSAYRILYNKYSG